MNFTVLLYWYKSRNKLSQPPQVTKALCVCRLVCGKGGEIGDYKETFNYHPSCREVGLSKIYLQLMKANARISQYLVFHRIEWLQCF